MSTVDEYHKYARDCRRWAARARTEEQRQRFLSLAHDWTQAALGLESVFPSDLSDRGLNEPPAAKALGLTEFNTMLARADEVTE
jgi:hypothetical protein